MTGYLEKKEEEKSKLGPEEEDVVAEELTRLKQLAEGKDTSDSSRRAVRRPRTRRLDLSRFQGVRPPQGALPRQTF